MRGPLVVSGRRLAGTMVGAPAAAAAATTAANILTRVTGCVGQNLAKNGNHGAQYTTRHAVPVTQTTLYTVHRYALRTHVSRGLRPPHQAASSVRLASCAEDSSAVQLEIAPSRARPISCTL